MCMCSMNANVWHTGGSGWIGWISFRRCSLMTLMKSLMNNNIVTVAIAIAIIYITAVHKNFN